MTPCQPDQPCGGLLQVDPDWLRLAAEYRWPKLRYTCLVGHTHYKDWQPPPEMNSYDRDRDDDVLRLYMATCPRCGNIKEFKAVMKIDDPTPQYRYCSRTCFQAHRRELSLARGTRRRRPRLTVDKVI